METSRFSGRYKLAAARLVPHLPYLCTNKMGTQTILRLVNQRVDLDAARAITDGVFFSENDAILQSILTADQMHGISFIQKMLSCPLTLGDTVYKQSIVEKVKSVLDRPSFAQVPAYTRLMQDISTGVTVPIQQERSPRQGSNAPLRTDSANGNTVPLTWISPSANVPASYQKKTASPRLPSSFAPWSPQPTHRASPHYRQDIVYPQSPPMGMSPGGTPPYPPYFSPGPMPMNQMTYGSPQFGSPMLQNPYFQGNPHSDSYAFKNQIS